MDTHVRWWYMRVEIGAFTRQAIEDRLGSDLSAGVEIAALFYVGKLRSGRGVLKVPAFLQNAVFEGPGVEIALNVGADVENFLWAEARREDITVDRLVAHSVFLYLAELDRLESDDPAEKGACRA